MAGSSDRGSAEADLEAYFHRIGYSGTRGATFETLTAIHFRHPQAIAFETLDPLLRRPIELTPAALMRKLVESGRGGWCFEHNLLLGDVLRALGFHVTGLAARVLWNAADENAPRPRSHMLLLVSSLQGQRYIADVGFGGVTLTAPLLLTPGLEQATPHETFRLLEPEQGLFVLQARVSAAWKSVYSFDLQAQLRPDYEVSSWHLENHPQSPFANRLMVARAAPDRRYALLNNRLSTHYMDGTSSDHVTIESIAEMLRVLREVFQIRLPQDPALERVLAGFVRS